MSISISLWVVLVFHCLFRKSKPVNFFSSFFQCWDWANRNVHCDWYSYWHNQRKRYVLLEDETNLSSKDKVCLTFLNLMMILPRCGLWYWCSKDHSDGEITAVRNGSDRSTVQVYLHGSTALHWNATAQNRGEQVHLSWVKHSIGAC